VTMTQLKLTLKAQEVKTALGALPARVAENVQKKAARRVFKPLAGEMGRRWLTADFRGPSAKHRLAIAQATQFDVRRQGAGLGAPIRIRLGVRYGRKGGEAAKGRQKVWHLLENGFEHRGSGRHVAGRQISRSWADGALPGALSEMVDLVLQFAADALKKGTNGAR